jgi:membrane dipeptidase
MKKVTSMQRRQLLNTGLAALCGLSVNRQAYAQQTGPAFIVADMHSHFGMFLPRPFGLDMNAKMRESGIGLFAWAIVDDRPWTGWSQSARTNLQTRTPKPGEVWAHFEKQFIDAGKRLVAWKIPMLLTKADLEQAAKGEPTVLLAAEAANFLEGDITRLQTAYDLGLRHTQLVHFMKSVVGDLQTIAPVHGGLSKFGIDVVKQCNQTGILIDLAHGSASLVDAALEHSSRPMVWSHSWIHDHGAGDQSWQQELHVARALTPTSARSIAKKGGVVGLWNSLQPRDPSYPVKNTATYADEMMRMCDLVGPEHVAFGTDLEGVYPGRLMTGYDDLRSVVDNLLKRGIAEPVLKGIFFDNYARVLRASLVS